jgi:uncharacterized protein involved in exopolysaccharide biosynthesis
MSTSDSGVRGLSPPATVAHPPAPERGVTLLEIINVGLRHRRSIVAIPLLCMAAGVLFSILTPRQYRADGAFVLQDAGIPGRARVSGIAAQLGVAVPGQAADVPQRYADLLRSRRFLTRLAHTRFALSRDGRREQLTPAQLFDIDGGNPHDTDRLTVKRLRVAISSDVNPLTAVVGFSVSTPWPSVSEQMGQQLLAMVSQFNLSIRQSQAAAERRFTEGRLEQAARELRGAEDQLQAFLESNRRLDNAPQLNIRRERLERMVLQRQGVYAMLSQSYEQARIDEVRDTPVLTVIEGPEGSSQPMSRGTVIRGLLLFVLGLMFALALAFWREMLRIARERQAPELREFVRLRQESLGRFGRRRRPDSGERSA